MERPLPKSRHWSSSKATTFKSMRKISLSDRCSNPIVFFPRASYHDRLVNKSHCSHSIDTHDYATKKPEARWNKPTGSGSCLADKRDDDSTRSARFCLGRRPLGLMPFLYFVFSFSRTELRLRLLRWPLVLSPKSALNLHAANRF